MNRKSFSGPSKRDSRDIVIAEYLDSDLSREAAIDELDRDTVREVDTEEYVGEDVEITAVRW